MAVSSLRFTSSRRLSAASNNAPPLRHGATGRAVHLIQFSLMDLGHAMPRSSGRLYSPDAVFGDETRAVVKKFQRSKGLNDDGEVGRLTMGALDRAFPRSTHRVHLHFRAIAATDVRFEDAMRNARTVFSQYGIDVAFGSGQSLQLRPAQKRLFDRIDQQCNWNMSSGEYDQLHRLGPPCPANHIKVYFVKEMRGALGCGGHAANRPAATVARAAWRWDMGHEVGHVLLTSAFAPVHHSHSRNLMHEAPANNNVIKVLTHAQVKQIRSHTCCLGA
jgi:hypothetical protein